MESKKPIEDPMPCFDALLKAASSGDADAQNRLGDAYANGDATVPNSKKAVDRIRGEIALAAKHDRARVMILGGSGTGKETVAQQIHSRSSRRAEAFVAFNCASVTPSLLEARLFGYEKGAFTGAEKRTDGIFGAARGGTLFLDEIGDLPLEAQALLLRVLQENKYQRLGGTEDVEADVRLITATNNDLARKVREKTFRLDLFQRLCTVQIKIPDLNERREDIRKIAERTAKLKLQAPFTYEVLLEDEELVRAKQSQLNTQIKALEGCIREYEEMWNHVK